MLIQIQIINALLNQEKDLSSWLLEQSMLSSIPRPNISYLLISTRTFVYQGVKNVKLQNTGKHLNKKHMHKMGSELECHRN